MGVGKKIGLVAFICAIIYAICGIIIMTQYPEISDEFYDIVYTDMERAEEILAEDMENASTPFKVANTVSTWVGLAGVVLSIVSLVKMIKANEKGKVFPVLALVIIIIFFIVIGFAGVDMGKIMDAAAESVM